MSEIVVKADWTEYFKNFSVKNFRRPVKLEAGGETGAPKVVRKMPFAGVYVDLCGKNAPRVEILLGGISTRNIEYATHTITNVESIATFTASGQTEPALEFVSTDGSRTRLTFEAETADSKTV